MNVILDSHIGIAQPPIIFSQTWESKRADCQGDLEASKSSSQQVFYLQYIQPFIIPPLSSQSSQRKPCAGSQEDWEWGGEDGHVCRSRGDGGDQWTTLALLSADFMINLVFSQVVDNHGVINIDAEDVGNPQLVSLVDDISYSPNVNDFSFRSRVMSTRSTATCASWKRNRMWRQTTSLDRRWWVTWTIFIISPRLTALIKTSLISIVIQEILPKMRAVLVDWMVITSITVIRGR